MSVVIGETRSALRPPAIPPHNLDAERAVLGAVLLEGRETLPRVIEILRASNFYTEAHRNIYEAMLRLFDRGEPVDLITLSEELRREGALEPMGGPAALALLVEHASIAPHLDSYLNIVREGGIKRELIQAATRIIERASNGADLSELRARAISVVQAVEPPQSTRIPVVDPWPTLAPEALYGLPGRLVETIAPYTEADPVATLGHCLVLMGNVIGKRPQARVQEDRHPCNLFVTFVGATSKGRKGTGLSTPRAMLAQLDEAYAKARVRTGLSSGEGVIYHVRDPHEEEKPVKERGHTINYNRVVIDHGEDDKRLIVIEPEFASVLRRMNGETNSLSAVLRQAWDTGYLSTLTRNSPLRATGAHVSVIGHITKEELLATLTKTERANGFANRFLFLLVKRSKILPEGARVPADKLMPLIEELKHVLVFAQAVDEIPRDEEARALWAEVYTSLSEGRPGLLGAITSRAEAQVLRLSVLYAVLDCSYSVAPAHVKAALAIWDYAEASARMIFGDLLGRPVADALMARLRERGEMTRTDIVMMFSRNRSAAEIDAEIDFLEKNKIIIRTGRAPQSGKGRPATAWRLA